MVRRSAAGYVGTRLTRIDSTGSGEGLLRKLENYISLLFTSDNLSAGIPGALEANCAHGDIKAADRRSKVPRTFHVRKTTCSLCGHQR
jgi:hypothetical protein